MEYKYVKEGDKTLNILSNAERLNKWVLEQFLSHLKGRILEVGSGTGNLSKFLIQNFGNDVFLSDIDISYVNKLNKHFKNNKAVKIDLENEEDFKLFKKKYGCVDSVISFNVLEHVKDDVKAFNNMKSILCKGGRILFLVPAHPFLFNKLDESFIHYRRYDIKRIFYLSKKINMRIIEFHQFNFFAIFGWLFRGTMLKRKYITEDSMKLYDYLTPLFKMIEENIINYKYGISYAVVLEDYKL